MMTPHERTALATAAVELRAAVDHFNHAADDLAAAGWLIASSECSRAVARCADHAADIDTRLTRAMKELAAA